MSDVPRKMFSRQKSAVQGCPGDCAGDTHHILILIALLSWNSRVRVTVPDSKLQGAAKGAGNWRRKSRQTSVSGQLKHKVSLITEGAPPALGTGFCIIKRSTHQFSE